MDDKRTGSDLIEAFEKDGCAICRLVDEGIERQINTLNYECVMDPDIREHVRAAAGFCPSHAQRWRRSASVLATAQIYADILDRGRSDLNDLTFTKRRAADALRGRARAIELLQPNRSCLICDDVSQSTRRYTGALAKSVLHPDIALAFGNGVLCFGHGRLALAEAADAASFDAIKAHLIASTGKTQSELAEVIRKHDYRYRQEPTGGEVGSGGRAVRLVAGEPAS